MRRLRIALAILLLAVSLTLLAWGIWPASREWRLLPITPTQMTVPTLVPATLGPRTLLLEFPSRIRAGDSDIIRLTLEASVGEAVAPTTIIQAKALPDPGTESQNAYETHHVLAEAVLDLPGMQAMPPGPVSEPFLPGEPVVFAWRIRPHSAATYRGTAWLFFIFVDKKTGIESRRAVSAQSIRIQVTSLIGLTGATTRVVSSIGIVAGVALAVPLAKEILQGIQRRRRANS